VSAAALGFWTFRCKVLRVVDGDTADVEFDLGFQVKLKHRVRLVGIDAPERGTPGYRESADRLTQLTLPNDLEAKVWKLDKYGRYLADLVDPDGNSINQRMILEGYAKPYFEVELTRG
jgi:micrococcal nuclease